MLISSDKARREISILIFRGQGHRDKPLGGRGDLFSFYSNYIKRPMNFALHFDFSRKIRGISNNLDGSKIMAMVTLN